MGVVIRTSVLGYMGVGIRTSLLWVHGGCYQNLRVRVHGGWYQNLHARGAWNLVSGLRSLGVLGVGIKTSVLGCVGVGIKTSVLRGAWASVSGPPCISLAWFLKTRGGYFTLENVTDRSSGNNKRTQRNISEERRPEQRPSECLKYRTFCALRSPELFLYVVRTLLSNGRVHLKDKFTWL
jgi:hypothetical protein